MSKNKGNDQLRSVINIQLLLTVLTDIKKYLNLSEITTHTTPGFHRLLRLITQFCRVLSFFKLFPSIIVTFQFFTQLNYQNQLPSLQHQNYCETDCLLKDQNQSNYCFKFIKDLKNRLKTNNLLCHRHDQKAKRVFQPDLSLQPTSRW